MRETENNEHCLLERDSNKVSKSISAILHAIGKICNRIFQKILVFPDFAYQILEILAVIRLEWKNSHQVMRKPWKLNANAHINRTKAPLRKMPTKIHFIGETLFRHTRKPIKILQQVGKTDCASRKSGKLYANFQRRHLGFSKLERTVQTPLSTNQGQPTD